MAVDKPALGAFIRPEDRAAAALRAEAARRAPKVTSPQDNEWANGWTADELMGEHFPDPVWAVPGLLTEGATLLAGGPKIGKSWLAFLLAVEVARGGSFGKADIEGGEVLYLALEDKGKRLQGRLAKLLDGAPAPRKLHIFTSWPALPDDGLERLERWLLAHSDARLVIIDVLAKVRGRIDQRERPYDADYRAMSQIKDIADAYNVSALVLHHVRKQSSEDYVDAVSGTNGLAGAADGVLVLTRSRNSADAKLNMTGRDIEEAEQALRFDPLRGRWSPLDGPASDYDLTDQRLRILNAVRDQPGVGPKQIAAITGIAHDVVKHLVRKMVDELGTDGTGHYFAVHSVHSVHPDGGSGERGEQGERDER